MTAPNKIPAGGDLDAARVAKKPGFTPRLPAAWTATVLLSPFGDSVSPLPNSPQPVVGVIECSCGKTERWMRAVLYLTHDRRTQPIGLLNSHSRRTDLLPRGARRRH
jgi:hypothetical protein